MRQLPFRSPPIALMPAGNREVTNAWNIRNELIELPALGGGQIVESLLGDAEPAEDGFDETLELLHAPIGKRRASMRRTDRCQRQDARSHVAPANHEPAI